ncbi:MAG: cupin domain-containing protein [Burkholderiales bacterium]
MNERARELAAALIRNVDTVPMEAFTRPPLYEGRSARMAPGTAARKLGATIDVLAPGKRGCPYHFHHAQEEMFVVLEGRGTLRVAGEMLPLVAGDVVFVPPGPEYPHQIVNTSDAPLKYLSISTKDTPEIVEYPDSGKYLAMAGKPGAPAPDFATVQPKADSADYWLGEP